MPRGCQISDDGRLKLPEKTCCKCDQTRELRELSEKERAAIDKRMEEDLVECVAFLAGQGNTRRVPRAKVLEDALALRSIGLRAPRALCRKRPADNAFDDAQEIASTYGAEIVRSADKFGMTMRIKPAGQVDRGGTYSKGSSFVRNLIFVA
jgi:hypothetical protein